MKKTLTLALAAALAMGTAQARTWTSADGGKTFNAEYVSQTDEYVTVSRGLKNVRFKIALLSEADRTWLEAKKAEAAGKAKQGEASGLGKIGGKLKGNMVRLEGNQYCDYEAESAPQYYIVYFTASW